MKHLLTAILYIAYGLVLTLIGVSFVHSLVWLFT